MTDDRLARAARQVIADASAPIELGRSHSPSRYVLVAERAVAWLAESLTPEQSSPRPCVSHDPLMQGGAPTLNGTRLLVEMLAERYWQLGHVYEREILQAYEIRRRDLLVCCWFVATHGTRVWRRRWGAWADEVVMTGGWRTDRYDEIALPPHSRTPLSASLSASGAAQGAETVSEDPNAETDAPEPVSVRVPRRRRKGTR